MIQNLVAKEYCFVPVHIVYVLYTSTGIIYALFINGSNTVPAIINMCICMC